MGISLVYRGEFGIVMFEIGDYIVMVVIIWIMVNI